MTDQNHSQPGKTPLMTAQEFLALLERVPKLLRLANQQQKNGDVYGLQDELRRECREKGQPFLYSMPYRHIEVCPYCGRKDMAIKHELEDSRRGEKITFGEIVPHAAQAHNVPPPDDVAAFLAACFEDTK